MILKAPFPYFGGKSAIAGQVWQRFGAVINYVEPFFGSGAVLLGRPDWRPGERLVETVNDADGLLCNFYRALKADPEGVAQAADWPVNECDLHARHIWLVGQREALTDRLMGDPDWFDAKAAGWWVWGACCWIGSGWCSGRGPWVAHDGRMMRRDEAANAGQGINRKLPHMGDAGQGINRQLPHMGGGRGVKRQLPHMGAGQGIKRQLPHMGDAGRGVWAPDWHLFPLADRLRGVRVACGDWTRVASPGFIVRGSGHVGTAAVLLDPPYDEGVGYTAGGGVSGAVWTWACENGGNPLLRIAVCGYDDGREVPPGWRVLPWATRGGYGNQSEDGEGRANARRERVWFSPHCIPCEGDIDCATGEAVQGVGQMGLFG